MRIKLVLTVVVVHCGIAFSFDQAIARIYQEKPYLKPVTITKKSTKKLPIKDVINGIALTYVVARIYCAHSQIFSGDEKNSSLFSSFFPQSLQICTKKGQFFLRSAVICCEAFAYKTLAHLLYYMYKTDFLSSCD